MFSLGHAALLKYSETHPHPVVHILAVPLIGYAVLGGAPILAALYMEIHPLHLRAWLRGARLTMLLAYTLYYFSFDPLGALLNMVFYTCLCGHIEHLSMGLRTAQIVTLLPLFGWILGVSLVMQELLGFWITD